MHFKVIIRTFNPITCLNLCLLRYGWLSDVKFTVPRENKLYICDYFFTWSSFEGQFWKWEKSLSLEELANTIKSIPALVPWKNHFQVVSTRTFLSTWSSFLTYANRLKQLPLTCFFTWCLWYIFLLDILFLISVFLSPHFSSII